MMMSLAEEYSNTMFFVVGKQTVSSGIAKLSYAPINSA